MTQLIDRPEAMCEFSGKQPIADIDKHKHNLIQIDPSARKLFRGVSAELAFTHVTVEVCRELPFFGVCMTSHSTWSLANDFGLDVEAWWKSLHKEGYRFRFRQYYELRVKDSQLQGVVEGVYENDTLSRSAVIRRMKRLIGNGLIIKNEVPLAKKQIVRQWKKDKIADARRFGA